MNGVNKLGRLVAVVVCTAAIGHAALQDYVPSEELAAPQGIEHITGKTPVVQTYPQVPLGFEPNKGQTSPIVRFLARGLDYKLFLVPDETVLTLRDFDGKPAAGAPLTCSRQKDRTETTGTSLRLKLVGANPNVEITGIDKIPAVSNYFIGNNPKGWHAAVPHYAKVSYRSIYPDIDVVYYGHEGALEYDFLVGPGAAPGTSSFRLREQIDCRLILKAT